MAEEKKQTAAADEAAEKENMAAEAAKDSADATGTAEGKEKPDASSQEFAKKDSDGSDTSAEGEAADDASAENEGKAAGDASAGGKAGEDTSAEDNAKDGTTAGDKAGDDASAEDEEAEKAASDERYMRLMAEFQNFKKRTAKEKTDIHAYANERIITELLPVLDNFERALAADVTAADENYAKGMELIFQQLLTALTNAGLTEIEAEGAQFNPSEHSAVMMADSPDHESNTVIMVMQKGYKLNGKVIRPAMVQVAN